MLLDKPGSAVSVWKSSPYSTGKTTHGAERIKSTSKGATEGFSTTPVPKWIKQTQDAPRLCWKKNKERGMALINCSEEAAEGICAKFVQFEFR